VLIPCDDDAVSDRQYGPFERPINITDFEWRLLEEVRQGRTVSQAAAEMNMPAHRLRFLLANLGQKLQIASKL
jgi:hypothetical protein